MKHIRAESGILVFAPDHPDPKHADGHVTELAVGHGNPADPGGPATDVYLQVLGETGANVLLILSTEDARRLASHLAEAAAGQGDGGGPVFRRSS